tara:strand:+ start:779 stop:958 length:180 start_codon:yes stop_codon:yes gene_type:complete
MKDMDYRWGRRDSKKKSKKNFASDNRNSVRWLYENALQKARDIQKAVERKQKEKDSWQN